MAVLSVTGAARAEGRLVPSPYSGLYFVSEEDREHVGFGTPIDSRSDWSIARDATRCLSEFLTAGETLDTSKEEPPYQVELKSLQEVQSLPPHVGALLKSAFGPLSFKKGQEYSVKMQVLARTQTLSDERLKRYLYCCGADENNCPGDYFVSERDKVNISMVVFHRERSFWQWLTLQEGNRFEKASKSLELDYVRIARLPEKSPVSLKDLQISGAGNFDYGNGAALKVLPDPIRIQMTRSRFRGSIELAVTDANKPVKLLVPGQSPAEATDIVTKQCAKAEGIGDGCELTARLMLAQKMEQPMTVQLRVTLKDAYASAGKVEPLSVFLYSHWNADRRQLFAVAHSRDLELTAPTTLSVRMAETLISICSPDLDSSLRIQGSRLVSIPDIEADLDCEVSSSTAPPPNLPRCQGENREFSYRLCSLQVRARCEALPCPIPSSGKLLLGFSRPDVGAHLYTPLPIRVTVTAPPPVVPVSPSQ
ncbi:hypothetical protein [Corallococcus sp. AB011P]|uniref:hypothetical protein n=1 Tax=Corallococcus sp. AB011P TaxID=2316735 RepID=UPI0011C41340|nr:hypothetical protein [Corallococcus sp. AB011P]